MPAKMKERQQRFDAKPAAANASVTAMCEVVWVRCREPPPAWLPWHATIVEKCGLLSNRSVLSVDNKGDEGYGYLEWIMWRWTTLPPCVYLLHGSKSHLRLGLDLLLRSQRSVSSLSRESRAVPLGETFVDERVLGSWNGRDDVRRGLDLFYRHLNQILGPLHGLPDIRGQPLQLHCCNTWLLTRLAIRSRSLEWWSALRSAALLPVSGYTPSGKTFAGFERTARNPVGHSEIGIIYEHIFHLALGLALNTTRVNNERVFRSVFNASVDAPCPSMQRDQRIRQRIRRHQRATSMANWLNKGDEMSCKASLTSQLSLTRCVLNSTYGCVAGTLWVTGGCRGVFHCNGREIHCGDWSAVDPGRCDATGCKCDCMAAAAASPVGL